MPRWDYKLLTNDDACDWYDENGIKACSVKDLCRYLNVLGAERWEIVTFKPKEGAGHILFKRKQ